MGNRHSLPLIPSLGLNVLLRIKTRNEGKRQALVPKGLHDGVSLGSLKGHQGDITKGKGRGCLGSGLVLYLGMGGQRSAGCSKIRVGG